MRGMSPEESLAATARIPAERFGLGDRGLVATGKRADLLLVKGARLAISPRLARS